VLNVIVWGRGVGSVHFLKAVVRTTAFTKASSHEVLTSLVLVLLMMGIDCNQGSHLGLIDGPFVSQIGE
jgi:hypothetical protein